MIEIQLELFGEKNVFWYANIEWFRFVFMCFILLKKLERKFVLKKILAEIKWFLIRTLLVVFFHFDGFPQNFKRLLFLCWTKRTNRMTTGIKIDLADRNRLALVNFYLNCTINRNDYYRCLIDLFSLLIWNKFSFWLE